MPTSNSRFAYDDCFSLFDLAIDDADGARVRVAERKDAVMLRTRLHTARRIDREENSRTYEVGHPMYGKSIYDKLVVRIKELHGDVFLYIEKIKFNTNAEALSSLSNDLEAPQTMKLINPPQKEIHVQRLAWRRA